MPEFLRNHILITGRTEENSYTPVSSGRSKVKPRLGLNRSIQGEKIRSEFDEAVNVFIENAPKDEFVYIVFKSSPNFLLDLEKLDDSKRNFRLASYRELYVDGEYQIYEATVYLNKKAISKFLLKIDEYIHKNTPAGKPRHQCLIANLDEVRAASLKSFWQEPELPFPDENVNVWWEIWIAKDSNKQEKEQLAVVFNLLENAGVEVGKNRWLVFPEHLVFLAKGTALDLQISILYSDSLAELRKPRETSDFFTYLDRQEQVGWIEELRKRTDLLISNSQISVCLLDTGVNRANPLLESFIPESNLDTVDPSWNKADTHSHGHGTPMATLILFGDLNDAFASNNRVSITHQLESVKIVEKHNPNKPELDGAITTEAVARAEIINAGNKRIVCMAVTRENDKLKGRPSSWSAAVDQILFGSVEEPNEKTLLFVSSGNIPIDARIFSPLSNDDFSIEDPAQSFNAITVGAYTLKDSIDFERFPGAELIAQRGAMAPCNTTSDSWDSDWPRKPDIVMEGGNHAIYNNDFIDPESLQLLTAGKGGLGRSWLTSFGDTSAATALAARLAAQLYHYYPSLWPESIRALIVHSANWTPAMLGNKKVSKLSPEDKIDLLRTVGYGVPNLEVARYSASNSVSLIIERAIKPYKFEESRVKTDEFQLIDLPWPADALFEMGAQMVSLKITLSYFIEPNPGNKDYELAASYRSCGLRFKMIDRNESEDGFKARVSKSMRDDEYVPEGKDNWILGSKVRDKGSIHKDIWEGTASDLATRNKVAVFPVGGWWKNRKYLKRYDYKVRYSLIVTIDTPENGIDIYTPIMVKVDIPI